MPEKKTWSASPVPQPAVKISPKYKSGALTVAVKAGSNKIDFDLGSK